MSWRSTASKAAALLGLRLTGPSCGGGSSPVAPDDQERLAILKISYYRALTHPKTQKLEATYRVIMSTSWQDRIGESPRDPFVKAAPGKLFRGFLKDTLMMSYVRELREKLEIDRLISANTDDQNSLDLLARATNPQETTFMRAITIATDRGSKSYFFRDQQRSGKVELVEIFLRCERYISRLVDSNTIQVEITTDRASPLDR